MGVEMYIDVIKSLEKNYGEKEVWNIDKLNNNFDNIKLDLDFQRRGPWSKKDRYSYIHSLFTGKASTTITIANVEECLKYSEFMLYNYYFMIHIIFPIKVEIIEINALLI